MARCKDIELFKHMNLPCLWQWNIIEWGNTITASVKKSICIKDVPNMGGGPSWKLVDMVNAGNCNAGPQDIQNCAWVDCAKVLYS